MKTLIKICGIKEAEMAYAAAKAGAEYIGLVFANTSPRYVTAAQAKEIVQAARAGGAEPVGVFTDNEATAIENICQKIDIKIAQLHGAKAHQQGLQLASSINCVYAFSVSDQGLIKQSDGIFINNLSSTKNKLLFDAIKPGSGKKFAYENFIAPDDFFWFLAGGLQIDTVASAIQQLRPSGVDVSSGVETEPGKKDLALIQKFIEKVKYVDTITR